MKKNVIIFGTSGFGLPAFSALQQSPDITIVAVVTQPSKPSGRSQQHIPTPVDRWADEQHITVLRFSSLKTPEAQQTLRDYNADLFVVASYGLILPQAVLDLPPLGCLNIHASLLPRWRGASPIAQAIAHGDQETGVTFMLMDAGCDTGPILQSFPITIASEIERPQLEATLSQLAAIHCVEIVQRWAERNITPTPQPTTGVTVAPRLLRDDGRARWEDADAIVRKIRAYTPWPGVWTMWGQRQLKIVSASSQIAERTELPGTIVDIGDAWGIVCAKGILIPNIVQMSGRQPQPAKNIPGSYPGFMGSHVAA